MTFSYKMVSFRYYYVSVNRCPFFCSGSRIYFSEDTIVTTCREKLCPSHRIAITAQAPVSTHSCPHCWKIWYEFFLIKKTNETSITVVGSEFKYLPLVFSQELEIQVKIAHNSCIWFILLLFYILLKCFFHIFI